MFLIKGKSFKGGIKVRYWMRIHTSDVINSDGGQWITGMIPVRKAKARHGWGVAVR